VAVLLNCDACARPLTDAAANVQVAPGEIVVMGHGPPRLRPTGSARDHIFCRTCTDYILGGIRHLIDSGGPAGVAREEREGREPRAG